MPEGLFHPDAETVFAGARDYLAELTAELGTPVLVGIDREYWHEPPPGAEPLVEGVPPVGNIPHNAVVCVNRDGVILGTYDKMHLLPFGDTAQVELRVDAGSAEPEREVAGRHAGVRKPPGPVGDG